jgi:hypothetical protein
VVQESCGEQTWQNIRGAMVSGFAFGDLECTSLDTERNSLLGELTDIGKQAREYATLALQLGLRVF